MLRIDGISMAYGEKLAVNNVSFELAEEEILVLLGPSGSGKSTLLKIIAGLESTHQGDVFWNEKDIGKIPTHLRGFGYMFQDYALFPHLNVARNISFGLEMAGQSRSQIDTRVTEMIKLVGLHSFAQREISSLSGGEQQRVALARAMAPQPKLLMLDEPLGSLDRALREELGSSLRAILKSAGQSSLYVTHDQEEAMRLADRVLLLNQGQIVQIGTPQALYTRPATRFAAQFLGFDNLYAAEIKPAGSGWQAESALGAFNIKGDFQEGPATLLLRPDRINIGGQKGLAAKLDQISFRGRYWDMEFLVGAERIRVEHSAAMPAIEIGKEAILTIEPDGIQVLAHE